MLISVNMVTHVYIPSAPNRLPQSLNPLQRFLSFVFLMMVILTEPRGRFYAFHKPVDSLDDLDFSGAYVIQSLLFPGYHLLIYPVCHCQRLFSILLAVSLLAVISISVQSFSFTRSHLSVLGTFFLPSGSPIVIPKFLV